jgi:hypothetical protein
LGYTYKEATAAYGAASDEENQDVLELSREIIYQNLRLQLFMVWQNVSDKALDDFLDDSPQCESKRSKAFEKFKAPYLPKFRRNPPTFQAPPKLPLTQREAFELLEALRGNQLSEHGVAIVTPLYPELLKYASP